MGGIDPSSASSAWRIYYVDGSVFSSEDGKAESAPTEGVEAIAEKRDGRRLLHVGGEFYRWDGCGWDTAAVLSDVKRTGPTMEVEAFKALKTRALSWLMPASR